MVRNQLEKAGIRVEAAAEIGAAAIEKDALIDTHYYSIASKATILDPSQLAVDEQAFEAKFGEPWQAVRDGQPP